MPFLRNGIRLSEIASMNFGLTPSLSAIAWPTSMSNPSMSPLCGFLKPNGGTSYFTPIAISPLSWILPIVVSAGNFSAFWAASSPPPAAGSSSSSPQPATASSAVRAVMTRSQRSAFMGPPSVSDG